MKSGMKLRSQPWLVVALLSFVGCLNYLDRTMITTMHSSLTSAMPMTNAQFGLLTSVFLWVYGLFSPVAGFLADKFSRSRVIIISLMVWSVVTWLTAFSTSFKYLLVTRALMGISEACYYPAALALIADYHRGYTRSFATAIHEIGVSVGASLGFLGGMIATNHHWSTAFSVFGTVGTAYALLLSLLLRDPPAKDDKAVEHPAEKVRFFEAIKALFSERSFMLMVIFYGLLGIVGWMILGWLPTYYKEHFNLSETMAGVYATGYLYPASLVGVLAGGFIADRWMRRNKRARILVPVIGLCIAAPCMFMAGYTTVLIIAIPFFMVYAFTRGFTDANLMPVLCMVADPRYRATGYGVLNMFSCIVGGLSLYAGGLLRDAKIDLSVIYQTAALIMVLCALLFFMIKPKFVNPENKSV